MPSLLRGLDLSVHVGFLRTSGWIGTFHAISMWSYAIHDIDSPAKPLNSTGNLKHSNMFYERIYRVRALLITIFGLFICSQAYSQESVGWIDVISTPSSKGAEIHVDGKFMATVPAKLKVTTGSHDVSIQRKHYKTFDTTVNIKEDETVTLSALLTTNAKYLKISTVENAEIWIDGEYVGKGTYSNIINFGKHQFEARLEGCEPTIAELEVDTNTKGLITLSSPSPIYGSLKVSSSVNAVVRIDGKKAGETPLFIDGTLGVGEHNVEISAPNHFVEKRTVIIKKDEIAEISVNLREFVDVTFTTKPNRTQIAIDGEIVGTTPYSSALEVGEYDIALYARNHLPVRKTVSITKDNKDFTFKLQRQYLKPSCFYLSGEYQILGVGGVKGSIGGYIKNVNIEANVVYGLKESEVIYWNIPSEMTEPCGYTYKPLYFGGRVGYGFIIGTRLRITPQAGAGLLMVEGTKVVEGDQDPRATNGYCIPAVLGAKVDFVVAPSVALCLTPNYSMAIVKSGLYEQLYGASKTIKGYASGVALSAGISFIF